MDPSSARLVDADLVEAALAFPVYDDDIEHARRKVRVTAMPLLTDVMPGASGLHHGR